MRAESVAIAKTPVPNVSDEVRLSYNKAMSLVARLDHILDVLKSQGRNGGDDEKKAMSYPALAEVAANTNSTLNLVDDRINDICQELFGTRDL